MKNLQVGFRGLKGGHGLSIRYRYIDGYKVGYREGVGIGTTLEIWRPHTVR